MVPYGWRMIWCGCFVLKQHNINTCTHTHTHMYQQVRVAKNVYTISLDHSKEIVHLTGTLKQQWSRACASANLQPSCTRLKCLVHKLSWPYDKHLVKLPQTKTLCFACRAISLCPVSSNCWEWQSHIVNCKNGRNDGWRWNRNSIIHYHWNDRLFTNQIALNTRAF